MISSIHIKNVATYDESGVKIDSLKKINFIYGANGTGKTTITNLLNDTTLPQFSESTVTWEHNIPMKTLVYNKEFRECNFGKGQIDGVFTLGEATKEEKEAITAMQAELAQIKADGIQKKQTLEKLKEEKDKTDNEFRDRAWAEVYKKYESVFKEAFTGVMRNKESFKAKLLEQASKNNAHLETFYELKSKAETIFGEIPATLPLISQIEYLRLIKIESDPIWEKKIVGKSDIEIGRLIEQLGINDWVNEGRSYIQDNDVCPFCQGRTISDDLRKQLDRYFDKTFQENIDNVKALNSDYSLASQNLQNLLSEIEDKEKANSNSKLNIELFSAKTKTTTSRLRINEELIRNKVKEPSRSIPLTNLKNELENLSLMIEEANKKIKTHNKLVTNYETEKSNLIKSIWRFLVEEYKISTTQYQNDIIGKQKGIDEVSKQREDLLTKYNELNEKIKEANKNVTSVQPSVDEINKTLKAHGFLNFEIVPSQRDPNQYQIQREDKSIAESTLSEGEITFITFLYFLQRAKGGLTEDSVSEERVLVIDDPISSLDSNVLFVVSTLIKEILNSVKNGTGVIKQVFLFTHNVYFHKEVSYISGKAEKNKDTHFWILRKKNKVSMIQAYLMENPIHNSYEMLWHELKNSQQHDSISIQNIMRRIIENYFKILGKYHYDDLVLSFKESPEEQEICRSMIFWINDGSHTIPDDLYIQAHDDLKDKYFDVFEKIFINTKHHEHFKMMMGIEEEATP